MIIIFIPIIKYIIHQLSLLLLTSNFYINSYLFSNSLLARSLLVSVLCSETKGLRFKSGC